MAMQSPYPLALEAFYYRDNLKIWLSTLSKGDRRGFDEAVGFRCLFGWPGIQIDWVMLRAVCRFWSADSHLFHFSFNEMCPTFEEFAAMTGTTTDLPIVVPSFTRPPTQALRELLGVSREESRAMVHGNEHEKKYVDITLLPSRFAHCANDDETIRRRNGALALCLFAKYLFVTYEGLIDARVVDVVLQVMNGGGNLIPLILGETLIGINNFASGAECFESGAPIIMHMWVQEHFRWIPPPAGGRFIPSQYTSRGRCDNLPTDEAGWITYFCMVLSTEIFWVVPHWQITHFVPRSGEFPTVVLPCLHRSTFYWATRILRQFGWEQVIPTSEEPVFPAAELTGAVARRIRGLWRNRAEDRTVAAHDPPLSVLLSRDYILWIEQKTNDHGMAVLGMVHNFTGMALTSGVQSRLWEIGVNPEEISAPPSPTPPRHDRRQEDDPGHDPHGEGSSGGSGKRKGKGLWSRFRS